MGGMPFRSKRARDLQSAASSRSPCTTWMATLVCPSTPVVKCSVAEAGIVELRWMMRATVPPSASMPSESGVTSSSRISSVVFEAPARMSACTAAPSATTSSGLSSMWGFLPRAERLKRLSTSWRTAGMRVDPPTRTTSSIDSAVIPASARACLQGPPCAEDRFNHQLEDIARDARADSDRRSAVQCRSWLRIRLKAGSWHRWPPCAKPARRPDGR